MNLDPIQSAPAPRHEAVARHLRTALVEAAHGAARKKDTYLQAQYRQLTRRKGRKRAAVAVAHSIVVIAYQVMNEQRPYDDLGPDYLDRRRSYAAEQRLVNQLRARGYTVVHRRVSLACARALPSKQTVVYRQPRNESAKASLAFLGVASTGFSDKRPSTGHREHKSLITKQLQAMTQRPLAYPEFST